MSATQTPVAVAASQGTVQQPAPAAPHESFLKKLGRAAFTGLTKVLPFLLKEATKSEGLVDLMFPLEGPLYNSVVTAISLAQVAGSTAAKTADSGKAKFDAVLTAVSPGLLAVANKHGLMGDDATAAAAKYVQAVHDLLDGPTISANPLV